MESNPNCAICNAPALPECPCESQRLTIAVRQAEKRAMEDKLHEIREWVIAHARAQILQAFNTVTAHRKAAHKQYLNSLPYYELYVRYAGNPPLHPRQLHALKAQIHEADLIFKRGIDNDWKESVVKYPEVLDYFYSLVEIRIPSNRSSSVLEPPPIGGGAGGMNKRTARERRTSMAGRAPPVAPAAPPPRAVGGYTYI